MDVRDYINGCDSFIDSFLVWNWKHCCDVHDIQYTVGGGWVKRVLADVELGLCVAYAAGPLVIVGPIMAVVTLLAGWLWFRFTGLSGRNLAEIVTKRTTPMSRELRPLDAKALEVMEGRVTYVYDDAIWPTRKYKRGEPIKGTLTAGVGHTGVDLIPLIGKSIPPKQIDDWLDEDNDFAETFVNENVTVKLNDNQFAALVFWVFNVGVGAAGKSTLIKKLNKNDYDCVPDELRKWMKTTISGKKTTSNGLIKRRADEIAYWLAHEDKAPVPVPRPANKPTGTQVAEREVSGYNLPEIITGAGGLLAPAAGFANSTGPVAIGFAALIVIAAIVVGAMVIKRQFFSS